MSRITTLRPVRLTPWVWHTDALREHVANVCPTCHASDCYLCARALLAAAVTDVAPNPTGATSVSGSAGRSTAEPPTPHVLADNRTLPQHRRVRPVSHPSRTKAALS